MKVLILGGGRFVGYHLLAAARRRGWHVTAFNHDSAGPTIPGVQWRKGERKRPEDLSAVASEYWDVVVDTWAGPPSVVRVSLAALYERVGRYCYISSVVAGAATVEMSSDYARRKRRAEQFVRDRGDMALIVRLGLVLGPREYAGRLAYWLRRLAALGPVLAPGRPERPIRYVDVRDAADAILDAVAGGVSGTRSLTSTQASSTTMGVLMDASARAVGRSLPITWVDDDTLLQNRVSPWTEIPLWIPEHGMDFDAYVQHSDLVSAGEGRSSLETAIATVRWLVLSGRGLESRKWLSPARETELLRLASYGS
jgi:2'-hydroxyisoflavone reductase